MSDLIVFEYQGERVAYDPRNKMWNLTEMHQAARSDPNKAPAQWLRHPQTAEYLAALVAKYGSQPYLDMPPRPEGGRIGQVELRDWALQIKDLAAQAGLIETRRGSNGGTWAHWQIAVAYAKLLNPHFHLQWNEWAMERQQQLVGAAPTSIHDAFPAHIMAIFYSLDRRISDVEIDVGDLKRSPRRSSTPRQLRRTLIELPAPKPPLRERMTEEHLLILALLDEGDARGIATKHLLAACGVTRDHPGVFYSRLRELRAEGYVVKAAHKMAPNRITDEGRAVLNECSGAA